VFKEYLGREDGADLSTLTDTERERDRQTDRQRHNEGWGRNVRKYSQKTRLKTESHEEKGINRTREPTLNIGRNIAVFSYAVLPLLSYDLL